MTQHLASTQHGHFKESGNAEPWIGPARLGADTAVVRAVSLVEFGIRSLEPVPPGYSIEIKSHNFFVIICELGG